MDAQPGGCLQPPSDTSGVRPLPRRRLSNGRVLFCPASVESGRVERRQSAPSPANAFANSMLTSSLPWPQLSACRWRLSFFHPIQMASPT